MPTIRRAHRDDLPAITEIYNEAGVGTTASYATEPVTLAERLSWFERQNAADFPVLVLAEGDRILGFASYGTFRPLAGYNHTVEHSVYIRAGHRAAGGGRMLVNALIDHARGRGIHAMVAVVDADNEASIAFHERLGFEVSGRLPEVGRKFGRWLSVVFLTLVFEGPHLD